MGTGAARSLARVFNRSNPFFSADLRVAFPRSLSAPIMDAHGSSVLASAVHGRWVGDWWLAQASVESGRALGGWKTAFAGAAQHGLGSGDRAGSGPMA